MQVSVIPCRGDTPGEGLWPAVELDITDECDMVELWAAAVACTSQDYPDGRVVSWPYWDPWFTSTNHVCLPREGLPYVIQMDGTVLWRPACSEITLASLAQMRSEKILDVRDDTVYYVYNGGRGNGEGELLLHNWEAFIPWLQVIAGAVGSVILQEVVNCIKGSYRLWRARRATPEDLVEFILSRERWDVRVLAHRLGRNAASVRRLLSGFGFVHERVVPQLYTFAPDAQADGLIERIAVARHTLWYEALSPSEVARIARTYHLYVPSDDDEWLTPDETDPANDAG
jgi:hypothetical protein